VKKKTQPVLAKNNLGLIHLKPKIHSETSTQWVVSITSRLFHVSGEFIETTTTESVEKNVGYMSHIQAIGSVSKFIKRYHYEDLLDIVTEEDTDGQGLGDPKNKNNKNKPQDVITDYQKTDKTEKTEEKPNPNYIYDSKRLRRYNKRSKRLNDQHQKDNKLISTEDWRKVADLVKSGLNDNMQGFCNWLKKVHKCEFYDIPESKVSIIVDLLTDDPQSILNI
jgi:hypothetical protein